MKPNTEKYIRIAVLSSIIIVAVAGMFTNFKPLPELTTLMVANAFHIITGVMPAVVDNSIWLNINNELIILDVSAECSGVIVMLLFVFVMFLTPHIQLSHRFGALIFIPALYLINILRIISEVMLGHVSNTHYMALYHSSVGQVTYFGAMVLSYLAFLYMFGYLGDVRKYRSESDGKAI